MDAAGSEVDVEDRSEVEVEDRFEVEVEDRSSCLEVATPAFAFPVLANSGQIDPRLMIKEYVIQVASQKEMIPTCQFDHFLRQLWATPCF